MNKILPTIILALLASNSAAGSSNIAPLGDHRSKYFDHKCSPEGRYTICNTDAFGNKPNDFKIVPTAFGTMRCSPIMINTFMFLDDRLVVVNCSMKPRDFIPIIQQLARRYGYPEERIGHFGPDVRRLYVWRIGNAKVTASDIIDGPDLFGIGTIAIEDVRLPD